MSKSSRTNFRVLSYIIGYLVIPLSSFSISNFGFAENTLNNGIIIDGINFALAQKMPLNGNNIPVVFNDIFQPNQPQVPGTWMIDCSSNGYSSCTSTFTKELRTATGNNITYLLLDFPWIDTDSKITTASTLNTCPVSNGTPQKFTPQEFNYVAPFMVYSADLGSDINVCMDGQKITKAFAANGHKVIPMISGDGSELTLLNNKNPTYLQTLANLIATEINADPNASGVAFDLESNIKGLPANQAFFGTLSAALKDKNKIIMIYDGEWASIKHIPDASNIIAMRAMYDFGLESSPNQNHELQSISPNSYGVQFPQELQAFLNSDAAKLNKMIVVPSAASNTIWTGLDILHDNEKDKGSGSAPSSYDPYLTEGFNPNTSTGDPDAAPSAYVPANGNQNLLLQQAPATGCPTWPDVESNTANCYSTPYPDQKGNDQDSYIKSVLSPETLAAIKTTGQLQGIIFYNIKPTNFYELNCDNVVQQAYLCLSFQPESTPASVIQDLNTFEKNLSSSS